MKENWDYIRSVGNKIGTDLDAEKAWNEFDGERRKKRRAIWFIFGSIGLAVLLGVYLFLTTNVPFNTEPDIALNNVKKIENINSNEPSINPDTEEKREHILSAGSIFQNKESSISNSTVLNDRTQKQHSELLLEDRRTTVHDAQHVLVESSDIPQRTHSEKADYSKLEGSVKSNAENRVNTEVFLIELPVIIPPFDLPVYKPDLPDFVDFISSRQMKSWQFGIQYTFSKLNRNDALVDDLFLQRRADGEKMLEEQTISTRLRRHFTPNIFIESGLTFGYYRSKLKDQVQQLLSDVVYTDQVTAILHQNGQQIEVIGDVVGSQTIINEYVRFQKYLDIKVPIRIGYALPLNRQADIEFIAGVNAGVFHKSSGSTYLSYFSSGEYQPLSDIDYKTSGIFQASGTVNVVSRINPSLDVYFGLNIETDLTDRLNTNLAVDKFSRLGLSFGMKRRL